ncbi:LysR family transcriptional regulator [Myxococcus sp. RHSTA-1-4]|uniref:LysR family transcriptional regulator n=1 Tax=Myxococcus sp. RHSTA-1-4 TaxID=2874601 RepID=UPI001CBEEDA9|nr:LysR family transcriptional regulator [Myxococcus sp. RHSTA-1-4]MBZ4418922.1 LysR family transcriptional regulator [Myxococcus sp. RHSTA-1-4]
MRNMQGLISFVETALGGSFTAAAAKLGVTPAAVGKNVMRLEQELGVRLFNRTTRRLRLTAEGEAFFAEAGDALRRLDEAVDTIRGAAVEPAGRVRISSGISFGRRFVLPLLPRLAQRYPRLHVELSLDNRMVDLVAEGYDIAVRGGVMNDSSLVVRRICDLQSVLVASPAYLRKHGVPATPADLASHRLLGLRFVSGEVAPWRFRKPSGRGFFDWDPPAQVWTSDPDSFVELAAAGEGICQAALLHAAPLLRAGQLRLVLHGQYDPGQRQMVLCYPHRQLLSKRVRVVADALWEGLSAQPDLGLEPKAIPRAWCAEAG